MFTQLREVVFCLHWRPEVATFSQRGILYFATNFPTSLFTTCVSNTSRYWITRVELTEQRKNIQKVEVFVQIASKSLKSN